MKTVNLTPRQNEALNICKTFYIDNDELPTGRTLGEKLGVTRSTGDHMIAALRKAGVIDRNEQGGLKWTRDRYEVVEVDRRGNEV